MHLNIIAVAVAQQSLIMWKVANKCGCNWCYDVVTQTFQTLILQLQMQSWTVY